MPARLKSFELHGYKTFASKNEFVFSDGITAIVGPNGSGKSNVADALRWVLGEQSFGLLRAKKTEDMIFSGSESRPRAGMASATILFDNSDGWLPIDFSEVGITRRAYRDGENEYLLNGQRVRLKDVSEVLAKSGLAERTYTIIGQGLVDAALALKAEERRRLFEEAAGIGLHRTRREEAIKRLETTRRNLERVQDILAELQPRLRSLERQSKRAQEYNQMTADLKVLLYDWYGYHWHTAQAELGSAQLEAKQKEDSLKVIQSDQMDLDKKISTYRSQINEIRGQLNIWHKELSSLHQLRETLSRDQAVSNERSRLLVQQLEQLEEEKIKLEEDVAIQSDQLAVASQDVDKLTNELNEARQAAADSALALSARQNERAILEDLIQSLKSQLGQKSSQSTQLEARLVEKKIHIDRLKATNENIERETSSLQDELSELRKQSSQISKSKDEKIKATQAIRLELASVQEKIANLLADQSEINEKLAEHKTMLAKVQAEINVLEDAEKNLTGYEEGARILLQAMKGNQIDGAIGSLGNNLVVPEAYESAIAAILGEYIDSLVVDSISHTEKALDLIDNDTVRGSIIPLDSITQSRGIALDLDKAPVEAGKIIGVAADLVKAEPQLKPIVDLLFGQVIVVADRKTARNIISSGDWRKMPNLKVVTLSGEVYLSSGPIIRGASRKGLLVRPRQRRESKAILEQAKALESDYVNRKVQVEQKLTEAYSIEADCKQRLQGANNAESEVNRQLSQLEIRIEKTQREFQWQVDQKAKNLAEIQSELDNQTNLKIEIQNCEKEAARIRTELAQKSEELYALPLEELQTQNTYWNTNTAVIDQARIGAEKRRSDLDERYNEVKRNQINLGHRIEKLELDLKELHDDISKASSGEVEVAEKITILSDKVTPLEDQLRSLEGEYNNLLTTDTEARQALRTAEQQFTQAKINLAHHQESFETLRGHIEDDFGLVSFDYIDTVSGPRPLPLDGMVEKLPKVATLSPALEDTIRQQKAQIRRMGAINPEAQNEYKEVKDRFEFLTSQVDDLTRAEADIREVIAELDLLMEREFRRTFDAVAQEFKQIFTRLFGGGSARLALTDPENMTDTGIDIEARLPGRREQGLALLSGGERSLTAAALVFALLRVSPTPFCILDEVDAMLDEANVSRFRDLLTELSEKTQFIVITHNRNTVQAASIIYGVTMGRDSASQVISLRMDELGEEFGV
jgi:chromosome segregation protein